MCARMCIRKRVCNDILYLALSPTQHATALCPIIREASVTASRTFTTAMLHEEDK